jgi:hypothetical protein
MNQPQSLYLHNLIYLLSQQETLSGGEINAAATCRHFSKQTRVQTRAQLPIYFGAKVGQWGTHGHTDFDGNSSEQ